MTSKVMNSIIFAAGAVIGSFVTAFIVKNIDRKETEAEINSVKESLGAVINSDNNSNSVTMNNLQNQVRMEADNYISNDNKHLSKRDRPYIITPEDFDLSLNGYEQIDLTLYSDGVLADDNVEMVEDVDEVVGIANLNQFGDSDVLYVRNDRLKANYEVLRDTRKYMDVRRNMPQF